MSNPLILLDELPKGVSIETMLWAYDWKGTSPRVEEVPLSALAPAQRQELSPRQIAEHLVLTSDGWRTINGKVLIHVDKEFNDEIDCGGVLLKIDTSFNPLHHVAEHGQVLIPPTSMGAYSTAVNEVRAGDKVYFHYHSISASNLVILDDEPCFLVDYEQLYCAIRHDSIVMLNDFCLVSPVDGGERTARTASGIILESDGKTRSLSKRGILRHAPPGRPAQAPLPAVGSQVAFMDHADLPLTIANNPYWVMDGQREMIATLF